MEERVLSAEGEGGMLRERCSPVLCIPHTLTYKPCAAPYRKREREGDKEKDRKRELFPYVTIFFQSINIGLSKPSDSPQTSLPTATKHPPKCF